MSKHQDPQKRAEAELDSLFKEMEATAPKPAQQEGAADEPAPEPQTGTPVETPPNEPAQDSPAASREPAPEDPPKGSDHAAAEDTFRQRFQTLQGKYNSEVPRLHAEVRALRRENDRLVHLFSDKDSTAPSVEETPEYRELVEEYGERAAKAMVGLSKNLSSTAARQEVQPLAERMQTQTQMTFHDRIGDLAGADWPVVNDDPEFVQFVKGNVDRFTGRTYHDLLNEAYREGDAPRVAEFFTAFKENKRASAPAQTNQPPNPPAQQSKETQQSITDQQAMVAPQRRSTAFQTETDNAPGKVWSMSEVDAFYLEVSKGRWGNRAKERQAIEKEIELAFQQGKVVG